MRAGLAAAVLALAAGCAAVDSVPPPVRTASAVATSSAEELLACLVRLKTLDEPALAAETVRLRELSRRQPSPVASVKLALALAASAPGDDAEALGLVEPLARGGARGDPAVAAMAGFLQGIISERRRLKENAAAAGSRAQNERRAHESQKQRAESLQERNALLQQKIDALTELEKSLSSRSPQGK